MSFFTLTGSRRGAGALLDGTAMSLVLRSPRGAALIDTLAACALMAILSAMAIPLVHGTRERNEARMATRYLATRLALLRVQALRRNQTLAMRFDPDVPGQFGIYADEDGDGVRQADIDGAIDSRVADDERLADYFAGVSFAIPSAIPAPDDGAMIEAGADPIRIGGTDLLSFSPLGTATSGTLYLVGRSGPQMCVRILGSTGRIRVMWYDPASDAWRQD